MNLIDETPRARVACRGVGTALGKRHPFEEPHQEQ